MTLVVDVTTSGKLVPVSYTIVLLPGKYSNFLGTLLICRWGIIMRIMTIRRAFYDLGFSGNKLWVFQSFQNKFHEPQLVSGNHAPLINTAESCFL